jgi:threonine/homoserine/homoserine lactone efflux protein
VGASLLAFAALAAVLTVTPGLDTVLVLRVTATRGRLAGFAAATGIGLGCLCWALASALGITALRTGLLTNLLNPKVGAFYLSVFPQFLPHGVPPLLGSVALAGVHIGEGIVWMGLVIPAVGRAVDAR